MYISTVPKDRTTRQQAHKTVAGGVATEYTLNGKNIVHLKNGTDEMHFFYDAQGKPAIIRFNGTDYFYVYDL